MNLFLTSEAKPTLPTNFEENTWDTLKSAIGAIFLKQPNPCDLEKLYQAVNDLCLHKIGGSLYQRIEKECEAYIIYLQLYNLWWARART
ncbi:Cullin-4 [Castilleja foliolosa]|uniref:Cullin-4 n=1 Tax=Castilleja foliolosa TaxID=1961234 RepID=A0ABD3C5S4_9LAMI